MVRHTLKILRHLLEDFQSVPDHFTTLRSKGLKPNVFTTQVEQILSVFLYRLLVLIPIPHIWHKH